MRWFSRLQTRRWRSYYGGLRGIRTFDWEIEEESAGRFDGERVQAGGSRRTDRPRGVTDLVIVVGSLLDACARLGKGEPKGTFLERLRRWALPPWLRPVAYSCPRSTDSKGSLTILEVVDPQNEAVAASLFWISCGHRNAEQGAEAAEHLIGFFGDVGTASPAPK